MGDWRMENLNLDFKSVVEEIREKVKVPHLDFLKEIEVVAFMGKMASGKDTLASFLSEKYGHVQVAFGHWLKIYTHKITKAPKTPKPQQLYQWFGQSCRQVDEDIWIKCLIYDLHSHHKLGYKKFVLTDLRQPNERLFCHQYRFPVIKVECDLQTRMKRIKKRGIEPRSELLFHETEKWIDILHSDIVIDNSGSLLEAQRGLLANYQFISKAV